MEETELEKAARKRVQMKRGFFIHLLLYVIVNGALIVIWAVTGRGYPWFVWPLLGWGIGIVANAIQVMMEVYSPEDRAVERELRRMHR
ncbi:MAG: 2TM domain-containing protein [Myxococcaceae bacterium]